MTFDEKMDIVMESIKLKKAGKPEEANALMKKVPMPAYLAKALKESFGAEALAATGHDLSEAEAEYGKDWLTR